MKEFVLRIGMKDTELCYYWTCLAESPMDAVKRCQKYHKPVVMHIFAVFECIYP